MAIVKFCIGWVNKSQFLDHYQISANESEVIYGYAYHYYHPDAESFSIALCSSKPEFATSRQVTYATTIRPQSPPPLSIIARHINRHQ